MTTWNRRALRTGALATLAIALAASFAPALAEAPAPPADAPQRTHGQRVVFGGRLTVPAGTVHDGQIVCIGGTVEVDGEVRDQLVVISGKAVVNGRVDDQLVAILSDLELGPDSEIGDELVSVGGTLDDRGAHVGGDTVNIPIGLRLPGIGSPISVLLSLLIGGAVLAVVTAFVLALLLAALMPDRLQRMSEEVATGPFKALFVGLVVKIVAGTAIVVLALTIVGIPLALLLGVLVWAIKWIGIVAVFHALGRRIGTGLDRDLSPIGAILLGFLPLALVRFIPLIGLLTWWILGMVGVGLVVTTRAGTAPRAPARAPAPGPPPGPPPPTEPSPEPPLPPEPPRADIDDPRSP